ncbi:ABC transporter ATP-binding protein [Priestia megaterium]|uniref:ABC transporter ATP-binding protein n=1 Tax=Priestia TaxID=2800373 RepID=UPI000BF27D7A|nr:MULTISPECIES: ABC transporter ATP-binding protein [Priestia]MDR4216119.1 ABC transporter ATP-binding protein [Priestia megaterium]MDR4217760.1 ABC transporter ATP-binding protein [Priestia megaterium]PFP18281.1 multidrug ABC transporter [Priestia megaterium]PFU55891.1 multidrug ABC transporter [Priestia megaterium]PGH73710.1 multidrug ABC transporter [Priestia megaterium]
MKHLLYFLKQIHSFAGKKLYVNLLATVFMSLLEGIGILLLIPMLSLSGIVNLDTEGSPIFRIFSFLQDMPSATSLVFILGIYVLMISGQNILQRQVTIQNTTIQLSFLRHMRLETYSVLFHADWNFFIKKRKSDLINLLTAEVTRAGAGTTSFLQFIASLVFTCIQIGLAFWLSPVITIFVLLFGLAIIFLNRKFLKRSLALGNRNFELGKSYLAGITDQINGIKDIKSNTLEESRMSWYCSITEAMKNEQVEYTKLKTTSQSYYKISSAVLVAAFIYAAVKLFHAEASQLMLIILIFSRLWPKVAGIQASMEQIATTLPAFKAVKALQDECRNAKEFEKGANQRIKPIQFVKDIECRNVYFRYNQDASYALQHINLNIPSNQMTAFVGRSGAGKSTLIDLLMGLNQPEKGQVLIDGIPLSKDNLLSLRRAISYVPQDPFLFNASIRENLLLVEPHASEEQMWEALEFSSAGEFVRRLPQGLDSLIGDRGIKLSGGERQRLVLARAILRNPSILVLDEATSALDTENEAKIQEALERLKGKMTIIVIAHRLSTIRNADQVIVLEQGEIIQQGGFAQLAEEKSNTFSKLLGKQMEAVH